MLSSAGFDITRTMRIMSIARIISHLAEVKRAARQLGLSCEPGLHRVPREVFDAFDAPEVEHGREGRVFWTKTFHDVDLFTNEPPAAASAPVTPEVPTHG